MPKKPIILIGAPIQNRESCITDYLNHIYNLEYPKENIILAFYINNSTDKTEEIIQHFQQLHQEKYKAIRVWTGKVMKGKQDDQTRFIRDYALFSVVRNNFLKKIRNLSFDYLFSIDSDVMVEPHTLKKLISNDKDVCAATVYNGQKNGTDFYNAYKWDNESQAYRVIGTDWLDKANEPFIVDVTGACYLIHRKVLDAGVKYRYYFRGEDGGFCQSAQKKGFTLWCDPTLRPKHLLSGKVQYRQLDKVVV